MAITSAFQADDAGSIPAARSSFLSYYVASMKENESHLCIHPCAVDDARDGSRI